MDKILESKFVLKGARASTLAALTAVEPNEADLIQRLPQLAKSSSGQRTAQTCPCKPNKEGIPPKTGSCMCDNEKQPSAPGSSHQQMQTGSPALSSAHVPTSTPAVAVAMAYYVEPDGTKVPFDILSPTSQAPGPPCKDGPIDEDPKYEDPKAEEMLEKVDEDDSVSGSTTSESAGDDSSLAEQTSSETSADDGTSESSSLEETEQDTAPAIDTQSCCQPAGEDEEADQSGPDQATLEALSQYATWEALIEEGRVEEAKSISGDVEKELEPGSSEIP